MVKLGKAMQCHFNREPSAVEISTFSRDKSRCTSELHWGRFFFSMILCPGCQLSKIGVHIHLSSFPLHHNGLCIPFWIPLMYSLSSIITMSPCHPCHHNIHANLSSPSRPTDPSTLRKFPGRCRSHGAAGRPPWSAAQWAARPCGARNAKIADL